MNRRRNQPRPSGYAISCVIIASAIISAGGVLHVFFKNCQIQTQREMDAIDQRIEHCRLEVRTMEMRMDQLLNRFVIRKQLEENGSNLHPISLTIVEEIESVPSQRRSVATAVP